MATERRYGGEEYYPAFTGLFGRGIGNDAKVLYGFLVYRSDGNQEWTDSIRGVARAIDVSFKMAVKAIGQLKAAKLIDCESISGGTHGGSTKFIILAGNTGPLPGLFTDEPRRKRAAVGSARASLRQRAALPTAARVDPVGSAIGGGVDPAGSAVYPVGSARAYISDSPHTESMKNKSSSSSSSSTAHVGAHTAGDDEEDEISKSCSIEDSEEKTQQQFASGF
ncbi:MAG: hypothetical protein IPK83_18610 [Planctomycetes bacterium]|nr:hypothetical protein [Planctomycetota bacterium]